MTTKYHTTIITLISHSTHTHTLLILQLTSHSIEYTFKFCTCAYTCVHVHVHVLNVENTWNLHEVSYFSVEKELPLLQVFLLLSVEIHIQCMKYVPQFNSYHSHRRFNSICLLTTLFFSLRSLKYSCMSSSSWALSPSNGVYSAV